MIDGDTACQRCRVLWPADALDLDGECPDCQKRKEPAPILRGKAPAQRSRGGPIR